MEFLSYITGHALVLIPALMIVGELLKSIRVIPDRFIPVLLLPLGIAGTLLLMGVSADAVVQGILITGAAVYGDQIGKQLFEKK